jgi:hypothetical protein
MILENEAIEKQAFFGFFKASARENKWNKNRSKEKEQCCGLPRHFRGSVYSLEGCSPAEPSSASTDNAKFTHIKKPNKLIYQHVN